MPTITFGGLASNLQTDAIVKGLVDAARGPVNRLQAQKRELTSTKDLFSDIRGLVSALQLQAQGLDSATEIATFRATQTNTAAAQVTVGTGASAGNIALVVGNLATAQRTISDGFTAKDQTGLFGAGTLSIAVGSTSVDFTVDGTTTLENLVSAINAADLPVTAGVIFDGTHYHLRVAGESTGVANAISFTEVGTTLGLTTPANTLVAAADASFSVDGIPMTRPSNTVHDAVPGVSFELLADQSTTITISRDTEGVFTRLKAFMTALIDAQKKVHDQLGFAGPGDARTLQGDTTLQGLSRALLRIASTPIAGVNPDYNTLASIGLTTQRDGTLKLDETKLRNAIGDAPESVTQLFAGLTQGTGIATAVDTLTEYYADSVTGNLHTREDGFTRRMRSIDDQIVRLQSRLSDYEDRLRRQFNALEQLISRQKSQGDFLTQQLSGGSSS